MPRRKRAAGSSSDGTEDSDELAESPAEKDPAAAERRWNTRLTRSSMRLSQSSSQDNCSPVRSSPSKTQASEEAASLAAAAAAAATAAAAAADLVFTSGRRVTRSQQGVTNAAAKKYPLRQGRSSGSDTEL
ncbi:hypothetical protein CRUP_029329, partial [Coryphaenoides rupestris]